MPKESSIARLKRRKRAAAQGATRSQREEYRRSLPGGVVQNFTVAYVRKNGASAVLTLIAQNEDDARQQFNRLVGLVADDDLKPLPESVPGWLR